MAIDNFFQKNSSAIIAEYAQAYGAYADPIDRRNTWYSTGVSANYLFIHNLEPDPNLALLHVFTAKNIPQGEKISNIAPWAIPTGEEINHWEKVFSISASAFLNGRGFLRKIVSLSTEDDPYIITPADNNAIIVNNSGANRAINVPNSVDLPIGFSFRTLNTIVTIGTELHIFEPTKGRNQPAGGWLAYNETTPPEDVPIIDLPYMMGEIVKIDGATVFWADDNITNLH